MVKEKGKPKTTKGKAKKKVRKSFEHGHVYIRANYNNTLVTLADPDGNVLGWSSPGANGYKGARQSTPYAGQVSAEVIAEKAASFGMKTVDVYVKGMGPGRDQTIRGLMNGGLEIISIADRTRLPHGGCRPARTRKV
ncbi:30S ribosomal protein S11 [Candidatus Gracilibacteria bacterium]|nr:30S ribosomal protein S11 [Candidatus Gracilibacteria bacterium]MCF7819377.1 30S ribosomal protein S11 [Candidatus Gracilibacteria bacterium]